MFKSEVNTPSMFFNKCNFRMAPTIKNKARLAQIRNKFANMVKEGAQTSHGMYMPKYMPRKKVVHS